MSDLMIILAHGSWHGPWSWDRVAARLRDRGWDVRAPQLPSSGPVADPTVDLERDAEVLRSEIADAAGPVLLVGHSSGGAAITLAGAGQPHVAGLVYLCAFMPDAGESILSLVGPDLPPWIHQPAPGLLAVDDETAPSLFYGACDEETVAWAMPQRTRRSVAADAQILTAAAWHEHTSLYVVCARDATIPPQAQRDMSQRATRVIELDADHFPQLSIPDRTADILAEEAERALRSLTISA